MNIYLIAGKRTMDAPEVLIGYFAGITEEAAIVEAQRHCDAFCDDEHNSLTAIAVVVPKEA